MRAKQKILVYFFILTTIILTASFFLFWLTGEEKISRIKEERADLNNNALDEIYTLTGAGLTIAEEKKIIWQSPSTWRIDYFVLADVNNDGVVDLNLSLWKAGSFGDSKPFWIKENDPSVKNHFFIYDIVGDKAKMIWGSSNLGAPNCEFLVEDINNDNKNDLVVIEGDYSVGEKCRGNYVAVWRWNGWGFFNDWRSPKGDYFNLRIEGRDAKEYIVVDAEKGAVYFLAPSSEVE